MPDAPMPQDASEESQEGGSPGDMLAAAGVGLEKAVSMVLQDPSVPPAAKKAFQAALAAFSDGAAQLSGGGTEGASTPEQGASGASPMSMQRPS